MADKKVENRSITLVMISIIAVILLTLLIIMTRTTTIQKDHLKDRNIEIRNLQHELTDKVDKISNLMNDLSMKEIELNKLNERLEGIKDADDLLRRDIFLFIDRKFQLVSKTIALEIANQIIKVARTEKVSPELLVGIIRVESAFNPMAISKKNARGLMQVMPEWIKKFKLKYVSDLHDIDTNIECGSKILKIHIKEGNGSISKGLYYYVGKSDTYAGKVFEAMGRFVAFRSTIDDPDDDLTNQNESEESDKSSAEASSTK